MNGEKFTPGPWDCDVETYSFGVDYKSQNVGLVWDANEANLHLVTAAPRLYNFAREVVSVLSGRCSYSELDDHEKYLIAEGKKVMARARGDE